MNIKFTFALMVFVLSAFTLLYAAIVGIPLAYAALIPALAGACIAAFLSTGGKK